MINPFLRTLFQNLHSAEQRLIHAEINEKKARLDAGKRELESIRAAMAAQHLHEELDLTILPNAELLYELLRNAIEGRDKWEMIELKRAVKTCEILIETYHDSHYEPRDIL